MNNRVKYAELEYRHILYNACKGILRVKQGEASGMLKTAYDLVPADYEMLARALERAQMMQAAGIEPGRAERKALEMFDRMPDMAKMKVMQAGGLNINSYQNRSVNNYGAGNIIGAATGENARAAGGAQNNNENFGGVQYGSGNQQNYVGGGAPGGGGGYGYSYPYPYPYPPGYGAPPTGGGGWGWGPNGWGYYGPDGKPTTPPTEGGTDTSDTADDSSEPELVDYVHNTADNTVLLTLADGTKKRIGYDDFKAKYKLGGPKKPAGLLGYEPEASDSATDSASTDTSSSSGGVGDRPVDKKRNADGTWTLIYADGRKVVIAADGKVISKTDPDGTTTSSDPDTDDTTVTDPDGTSTVIAGTTTGDPKKDLITADDGPGGGPTDADYDDMKRIDHRNKFVNDYVDRQTDRFNKQWNGAGIASGLAGAATMGTGGYHVGNALAKKLGLDDKGWGAKALRWGGAALGAGLGGTTGYYGAKAIDRAGRRKGYRDIGGKLYDRDVKPIVKDMDPAKLATASYSANLVKKLRKQGYRYI